MSRYEKDLKGTRTGRFKSTPVRTSRIEDELERLLKQMPDWTDYSVDFFQMDKAERYRKLYSGDYYEQDGKLMTTMVNEEAAKGRDDSLFIMPGDTVIALADGGRDKQGLPREVPEAGRRYIVHSFYVAPYGMGVILNNLDGTPLDNYPYRGYVFARHGTSRDPNPRIFFKKDDEE